MINYIIRRTLYAIPIVIGVNIIVFFLFFGVNSPDDMARLHLGGKRVTHELIDNWKKERSLDFPSFYNNGFSAFKITTAANPENKFSVVLEQTGKYRLWLKDESVPDENSQNKSEESSPKDIKKDIKEEGSSPPKVEKNKINIENFSEIEKSVSGSLKEVYEFAVHTQQMIEFEVTQAPLELKVFYGTQNPAVSNRLEFQYQKKLSWYQHFTDTIFFQKSLKMLFFDFGKSDRGKDIKDEIVSRILPSMSVTIPIFVFSLLINVFIAMLLAYFRGTSFDNVGVVLCVVGMSVSAIIFIILGQVVFGKWLKWYPISGFGEGLFSLKFIILPVIVALIAGFGSEVRFYRTLFLEEMNKDYIKTARAKGLSESRVLFVHLLKNAMIPILTGVVVSLPLLFIGSLLLESFFGIPGMGSYLIDAISQQDFAVVQSMVSLGSFLYIVGLMLTDISYTIVDPRVVLK